MDPRIREHASIVVDHSIDCEAGDENPVPIAFWTMIHFMMKHQGYD